MSLFEQKYPNNIRTITGLVNIPFQDDVVLECNTLLGAVAIQLQTIPTNFWSTQYKLYVVDKNNNASLNNITIFAPVGYTINGVPSVVINTNGGSYLIRVASNTNYIGLSGSGSAGGGGGYNLIEDETIPLVQRTTMNFTGGGVVASDDAINSRTNILINGGIVSLTNAQMLLLISTNAVIAGQFYLITDADLTDGGLVVQGIETNKSTTLQGSGLFFDADYQGVGNYSGVVGFVSNKGIWSSSTPFVVVIGDVVVWNNLHFKNLTGVYTDGINTPDNDPINWQLLAKSATTGYIRAVDFVKYKVDGNYLLYRADKRLNEVDRYIDTKGKDSVVLFQWGRNEVSQNKLRSYSLMKCTNSYATFIGNILDNGTIIDFTNNQKTGIYGGNTINGSIISVSQCNGKVLENQLSSKSELTLNLVSSSSAVSFNSLANNSFMLLNEIDKCNIRYNNLITNSVINTTNNITKCDFEKNYFSNFGGLTFTSIINFNIIGCEFSDISADLGIVSSNKINRKVRKGYSNWDATLDLADPTIWNGTDLTINPIYNYIGNFTINNANPLTPIIKIINLPTNHPCLFTPTDTQQCAFQHTTIGASVANDLLSSAPVGIDTLTGRADGGDIIEYKTSGTKNIRTNLIIIA